MFRTADLDSRILAHQRRVSDADRHGWLLSSTANRDTKQGHRRPAFTLVASYARYAWSALAVVAFGRGLN
jgi:hypothetical protein